jgi:hypothetical protein
LADICKCGVTQKVHAVCVTIRHKRGLEMRYMSFSCARWRADAPVHADPQGAIDGGSRGKACAFTMNSVARERFHIYISLS